METPGSSEAQQERCEPGISRNWTACTARKLSVAKNTNKADRVTILQGYDESRTAMELLLESQRLGKHTRDAGEDTSERLSRHCLYRLLNVLFSEGFFERFITSGDALSRRRELDEGGRRFGKR
ncbi:hypothetical protein GQ600_26085 [Phytophthora cactorum]|nr:hypothetical protein GQ600_26085 [Phytophthora cactorum]